MNSNPCSKCGAVPENRIDHAFVKDLPQGLSFGQLLNSNDPPLDADVAVIRSALSETDAHLVLLGGEIARLRERLQLLRKEELTLSIHRTRTSAILSPLRRFPPEILAEIFMWSNAMAPRQGRTKRAGAWRLDSPWLLTHVCRYWKQVCIGAPSLWSLVPIIFDPDPNIWVRPSPMLELQIARAAKLHITFVGSAFVDSAPQTALFRCLAKYAALWEELDLILTPALAPLLAELRDRLPTLRRACVRWYNVGSMTATETIDFLETAPSLVDVTIRSEFFHFPSLFPAHNLTRYELNGPWHTHRRVLQLARNLVEAHIETALVDDPRVDVADPGEVIELLNLRRLRVSAPQALKYMQAPALEELALTLNPLVLPLILEIVRSLLSRSSCRLRVLALFGCPDAETSLALLQEIPSLVEFRIVIDGLVAIHGANTLLAKLTVSDGSPPPAPHLSCISLGVSPRGVVPGVDYQAYLQMLQSRWRSKHCALTSSRLLICAGHGCSVLTLEGLKRLRLEGLDFCSLFNQAASSEVCRWMYSSSIHW
ncbi:hypothetical protein C8R46DRAFT_434832 [Mycena filopes]|nr:hypothetical protein C8R46DRAFT_434832 [Mycena filopes]